ncbi:hypothetical protein QBC38DRAFT_363511 [Podospora fimiseda]|uniref:Polyprenal reductase n=1 Tax=Podospora fimiseda TaxID=252190 RepID=A0AAN7H319_9PEZI|nr:hypothetical protein QBC38DRAFT_363511 [Podospora fimiseda]
MEKHYVFLTKLTPAEYCQSFFLLSAASVLFIAVLPDDVKKLLVDYGARKSDFSSPLDKDTTTTTTTSDTARLQQQEQGKTNTLWNTILSIINTVTSRTQIPHSYFILFYIFSLISCLFWGFQYFSSGSLLSYITSLQPQQSDNSKINGIQVVVAWTIILLQSLRRIYEHLFVLKPSKSSSMWIIHFILGLAFYFFINISIFIEGASSSALRSAGETTPPILKLFLSSVLFLYAWTNQFKCHAHLSTLKKYSLPTKGLFQWFICAHYTCEVLLYTSLAIVMAPEGMIFNKTILAAVVFVGVNLGVTARGTRKWYENKFEEKVGKWNMIPFIF